MSQKTGTKEEQKRRGKSEIKTNRKRRKCNKTLSQKSEKGQKKT
jgi:hypothetical protein